MHSPVVTKLPVGDVKCVSHFIFWMPVLLLVLLLMWQPMTAPEAGDSEEALVAAVAIGEFEVLVAIAAAVTVDVVVGLDCWLILVTEVEVGVNIFVSLINCFYNNSTVLASLRISAWKKSVKQYTCCCFWEPVGIVLIGLRAWEKVNVDVPAVSF